MKLIKSHLSGMKNLLVIILESIFVAALLDCHRSLPWVPKTISFVCSNERTYWTQQKKIKAQGRNFSDCCTEGNWTPERASTQCLKTRRKTVRKQKRCFWFRSDEFSKIMSYQYIMFKVQSTKWNEWICVKYMIFPLSVVVSGCIYDLLSNDAHSEIFSNWS